MFVINILFRFFFDKSINIPVKKVRKQDCASVDHNQIDDPLPYKIIYSNNELYRFIYDFKW